MTSKQRTMREMHDFFQQRALKIQLWMNTRGLTVPIFAHRVGVTAPRMRDYLAGHWIPAPRLRKMQELGVPSAILYLDGKVLHDMVIERP